MLIKQVGRRWGLIKSFLGTKIFFRKTRNLIKKNYVSSVAQRVGRHLVVTRLELGTWLMQLFSNKGSAELHLNRQKLASLCKTSLHL